MARAVLDEQIEEEDQVLQLDQDEEDGEGGDEEGESGGGEEPQGEYEKGGEGEFHGGLQALAGAAKRS